MDAVAGQNEEDRVVQRQDGQFRWVHGAALILLAAAVLLAPTAFRRAGFHGFVLIYAIAAMAWLPLVRPFPFTRSARLAAIVAALALRIPFLASDPNLSGDVYRYLSDGRMSARGINPYTYTPSDPRINHPEIRSIYPPHAQLLFALVHQLFLWRLLIIAFDVLAIVLLREHGLAYAVCPLVVFEGAWNGHLDAIAAVFLLVAVMRKSGAALAFAGGLKIIPLAAVPAMARGASRKNVIAFLATLLLPILPFLGKPIMPGFREYATRWIFNAPAYDLVRALAERIPLKDLWTHSWFRFEWNSDYVYRHLYADFVTRAVLAVIAIAAILVARRVTTALGALLLCSPAIHPWYWLAIVPLAIRERSAWIWLALCAPASYLLYESTTPMVVYVVCYGVPAAVWIAKQSSTHGGVQQ